MLLYVSQRNREKKNNFNTGFVRSFFWDGTKWGISATNANEGEAAKCREYICIYIHFEIRKWFAFKMKANKTFSNFSVALCTRMTRALTMMKSARNYRNRNKSANNNNNDNNDNDNDAANDKCIKHDNIVSSEKPLRLIRLIKWIWFHFQHKFPSCHFIWDCFSD